MDGFIPKPGTAMGRGKGQGRTVTSNVSFIPPDSSLEKIQEQMKSLEGTVENLHEAVYGCVCEKFINGELQEVHMRGLQEQVRDARHVLKTVIKKIYCNDVDHPMLLETEAAAPRPFFWSCIQSNFCRLCWSLTHTYQ